MRRNHKISYTEMKSLLGGDGDEIFDPDENLYNRPEDDDISTISQRKFANTKRSNSSKNKEINSNIEKKRDNDIENVPD